MTYKKLQPIFVIAFYSLYAVNTLFAQDKLVRTNSEIVLSKVIEIGQSEIKYKKFDNLDGPIYTEDKANFVSIIFENGKIEAIVSTASNMNSKQAGKARFTPLQPKYKNSIDFDFFSFYTADVSLQYTRYLKNEHFAITVPFRIGWYYNGFNGMYLMMEENRFQFDDANNQSYYYSFAGGKPKGFKILSGVNVKYFFKEAVKFRGYIAPEFTFGIHKEKNKYMYFNQNTNNTEEKELAHTAGLLGIMGVFGFQATPSSKVFIKVEMAGGYGGLISKNLYDHHTFVGRATFAIGVNFKKK